MALIFDPANQTAVIVAFIFTVVAVSVATMFLSCFGKKKDKKKGHKKGKAPAPSPKSSTPSPPPDKAVRIEQQTDAEDKPGSELKVNAEVDDLGDFSAVQRETEILRSEINDEASLQLSYTSQQDTTEKDVAEPEAKLAEKEEEIQSPTSDKANTSQGRSSMLDDIELTLATLHSDTKREVADIHSGILNTADKSEKKVELVTEKTVGDLTNGKEVMVKEVKTTVELNAAPAMSYSATTTKEEVKEKVSPPVTLESVSVAMKETKTHLEKKTISSVSEVKEDIEKKTTSIVNTAISKLDVTPDSEKKDTIAFSSATIDLNEKKEVKSVEPEDKQTKVEAKPSVSAFVSTEIKPKVTAAVEGVQETVKVKIEAAAADAKEAFGFKSTSAVDDKQKEEEVKVNGTMNDLEKASSLLQDIATSKAEPTSPKVEVKIPPKVSPKPSPKMTPRPVLAKTLAIHESSSQESNSAKDELNSPSEAKNLPTSPTSPASPTQIKAQSKIPMSKKTSAIPKLALSSTNKSSSVSPLSSPDSTKIGQIPTAVQNEGEQIVDKVKELTDKTADDLKHSNQEVKGRESKEKSPEPDSNSSPFQREGRGSKSRLTKLRYSGRKSADSKSDDSGSERGSRAGSEAKSEDDKKMTEDPDQDKSSRIPVRAGSKPRSSPPKALGD